MTGRDSGKGGRESDRREGKGERPRGGMESGGEGEKCLWGASHQNSRVLRGGDNIN